MNSDNLIVLSILICCLTFCGEPDLSDALMSHLTVTQPQEELKIIELDIEHFLTVEDLTTIYECVDIKVRNQSREVKFPCIAVRGDSF